jgi:23S rRNA A2030 N6-methylase RlmJ
MRYPGSARLVWELAKRKRSTLEIEAWDIDNDVAAAWSEYAETTSISFHLGDGFSGVMSLLNEAIPGLLLIDPPFLDSEDVNAAEKLFDRARELGWTVLCWHMVGTIDTMDTNGREFLPESRFHEPFHESFHEFSIQFSQIGLDYCGAKGCAVAVNSPHEYLEHRLEERIEEFRKIIQKYEY